MNIIGIVCEFNPFHNGHLYMLEQSRKELGQDAVVICAMSGDYVQRGEAALFSKYARAEAACRCGADIVAELPLPRCLSSAERYASGAVDILARLGCTHISFGSECGDIGILSKAADILLDETINEKIVSMIRENESLSYARARQKVLREAMGEDAAILSQANNILAIEYIKAIRKNHPDLTAFTVKRIGGGHDEHTQNGPKSASELREMIFAGAETDRFIPADALKIWKREEQAGRITNRTVSEAAVLSRLRLFEPEYFDSLPDASDGTGRRLYNAVHRESGIEEIISAVSDKKTTRSRVRRMILCAAFQIRADCTNAAPPYTRLLAMTDSGKTYLNEHRRSISIPLVTKPALVKKLDETSVRVFRIGSDAHDMLTIQFLKESDRKPGEDWRKGPTIV